jgi:hypothetical protein
VTRFRSAPDGSDVSAGDNSVLRRRQPPSMPPMSDAARTESNKGGNRVVLTSNRTPKLARARGPAHQHDGQGSSARCPVECPNSAELVASEKKKISLLCGIEDGETRTRTGDTTIFSRAAVSSETHPFAGNSLASGHVYGVRVFPDFAPASPALRQMAVVVCLFVGGHGDPDGGRGGAARRVAPGARLRGRRSHSVIADRGYDHDKYRRDLSPRRKTGDRPPLHRPRPGTRPRALGVATSVRLAAQVPSAPHPRGTRRRPALRAPEPRTLA